MTAHRDRSPVGDTWIVAPEWNRTVFDRLILAQYPSLVLYRYLRWSRSFPLSRKAKKASRRAAQGVEVVMVGEVEEVSKGA